MKTTINTHFLPQLLDPHTLAGSTVVVIDVLRASTTVVTALAAGARTVFPCLEIEEALEVAQRFGEQAVLGGERGGRRIAGFDLGNSPAEYVAETVADKVVVFTTTNGTRAMQVCRSAERVLIGAFVNHTVVAEHLATCAKVDLVCAGTRGEVTREDVLFAGAIVARLAGPTTALNDASRLAWDAWSGAITQPPEHRLLTASLQDSQGGRNLLEIGQAADIAFAAQLDMTDLLPELDVGSWQIRSTTAS
ncbi:MAG: 2-phosphosulfolactate phosphatase [Planctomycetaceae bacterium]|nr:2-phosphosulfolactate phosphatase [Planctomycetaceae bacterium]